MLLSRRIRELLYEQGFTISGARNRLDSRASALAGAEEQDLPEMAPAVDVEHLRAELLGILDLLKNGQQPA